MAKWTTEQQAAIDARDCNLLVAAAAGSGKTAVLVERILQLIIKDGIDIGSLLVVTFTNAAAGEMRERIGAALAKAIDENPDSSDHLRKQLSLLSKASISTLHSFCISVIRKYFHVINLDPGFRIGDETECGIIKLEVLEELFEAEYEKADERFLGLVERFGDNRQDTPLQDLILKLYSFIQSKPYPGEWLADRVEDFAVTVDNIENSPWCKVIGEQLKIDLIGALDLCDEALALCRQPGGPLAYDENILDDKLQLENLISVLDKRGLRGCALALDSLKFSRLKSCSKDVDDALKDAVKDVRDKVKKILKDLGSDFQGDRLENAAALLNELHPYMQYLCRLILEFDSAFKMAKHERGIIDFNDLEHYTLDILQNAEIAEELSQKYSYIFVDEYQDSNIVQETILSLICKADNMFMVGDVKQSIYRFRLADPSIFLDKYETYKPLEGEINRRVDLNRNFRSRPHILDGVNYIFENIMSSTFGELDYDEKAALYQGLETEPIDNPEVELHLLEKNADTHGFGSIETNTDDSIPELITYSGFDASNVSGEASDDSDLEEEIENLSDIEAEAMLAAQRIKELTHAVIYDARLEDYRQVQYRDIVILMRSTKGRALVFQEVLSSQGIPVYADVNSGYFDTLEIKTIVNLLKLIDNKCQDIPLLTVLRSPIGGFDAEDLIQIRTKTKARMFYQAVADYMAGNDDELSGRLKGFYQKIRDWQDASRFLPMEDFIWKLYTESGYYIYTGAMPGGLQRQANLRILLDRARQFQETSVKGLFQFLRFIEKLQSSSGDMGAAKTLGENENVLRIMSIHKSKGLEFPVVIVAGLGKQFNLMDLKAPVLFHKDLGIGPRYVNPKTRQTCDTLAKSAMKRVIRLESLAEEMRILYVALTRAKDKLILLGSVRDLAKTAQKWSKKISPYSLSKGKTFLDWICPVLLRHEDCVRLRQLIESDFEEALVDGPSGWQTFLHTRKDLTTAAGEAAIDRQELIKRLLEPSESIDEDLLKIINDRFSWSYPTKFAATLPSKLTVTEIKHINTLRALQLGHDSDVSLPDYTPTLIERPKFMEGTKSFTAAERGTIMHFVLQHLDLKRIEDEGQIREQVQEMTVKELLTEEEAQAVDIAAINSFFMSETGRRIVKAPKVWREVPFNYRKDASEVIDFVDKKGETLLVQGIIDCYFEEDEQWVLVDYKTDFVLSKGSIEKLVNQYRIQIELYAEALEIITGKPVKEKILYLLSINQAVKIQ